MELTENNAIKEMEEYIKYCYQVSLQFGRGQRTIMLTFFWIFCFVNLSILGRKDWAMFNLRLHVRSWSDKILLEVDLASFITGKSCSHTCIKPDIRKTCAAMNITSGIWLPRNSYKNQLNLTCVYICPSTNRHFETLKVPVGTC